MIALSLDTLAAFESGVLSSSKLPLLFAGCSIMSLVSPCSPSNLPCELQLKPSVSLLDDSLQLQAIELLPGSTKKGRKLSTSTLRLAGSESPLSFVEMGGWVEESVSFKNLKIELISNTQLKENTFFRINQHSGRWIRRETFTRVPFFNSFASPAVVLGVFAFLQCIHALRLPLSPAMWTKHLLKHEKYMIFERVLGWGCCLDKTAHSHVKGFTCRPKVSPITHAFAVINTHAWKFWPQIGPNSFGRAGSGPMYTNKSKWHPKVSLTKKNFLMGSKEH